MIYLSIFALVNSTNCRGEMFHGICPRERLRVLLFGFLDSVPPPPPGFLRNPKKGGHDVIIMLCYVVVVFFFGGGGADLLEIDSPFCSTIVLFKNQPFSLGFWRFSRKKTKGFLERMGKVALEIPQKRRSLQKRNHQTFLRDLLMVVS